MNKTEIIDELKIHRENKETLLSAMSQKNQIKTEIKKLQKSLYKLKSDKY